MTSKSDGEAEKEKAGGDDGMQLGTEVPLVVTARFRKREVKEAASRALRLAVRAGRERVSHRGSCLRSVRA